MDDIILENLEVVINGTKVKSAPKSLTIKVEKSKFNVGDEVFCFKKYSHVFPEKFPQILKVKIKSQILNIEQFDLTVNEAKVDVSPCTILIKMSAERGLIQWDQTFPDDQINVEEIKIEQMELSGVSISHVAENQGGDDVHYSEDQVSTTKDKLIGPYIDELKNMQIYCENLIDREKRQNGT